MTRTMRVVLLSGLVAISCSLSAVAAENSGRESSENFAGDAAATRLYCGPTPISYQVGDAAAGVFRGGACFCGCCVSADDIQ
jgi:hypothetical protein